MISNEIKSQVLIQALPYIKKYSGQIVLSSTAEML